MFYAVVCVCITKKKWVERMQLMSKCEYSNSLVSVFKTKKTWGWLDIQTSVLYTPGCFHYGLPILVWRVAISTSTRSIICCTHLKTQFVFPSNMCFFIKPVGENEAVQFSWYTKVWHTVDHIFASISFLNLWMILFPRTCCTPPRLFFCIFPSIFPHSFNDPFPSL